MRNEIKLTVLEKFGGRMNESIYERVKSEKLEPG